MKLEVGKTYKTRDGGTVTLTSYSSENRAYPFRGVFGVGGHGLWTAEGLFFSGKTCNYDLVEEVGQSAARPTPAMRQKAIFEAMDFRVGDKVVIGARIERTNGEHYSWHYRMQVLMNVEAVGTITRIIKYGATDTVEVTFNSHDKYNTWVFLPQCLEHYTPEPHHVALNDDYRAVVSSASDEIQVGCQTFGIDKVREVLSAWEKLNK